MTPVDEMDPILGRTVQLDVEDGVAVVRIDQPGKSVNVLSAQVVEEMAEVIERLEAGKEGVRAAVITSGKPGVWIAGADVDQLKDIDSAADGAELARTGHRLLARLEGLGVPVVAAIDGAALGGGLEVALACAYRVASDSPKTKLGLPEVQLGLLPGAGGTQRLPRLVGLRAALDLMLTGKQLDAKRARKIGLVDEIVPTPILLARARAAALELADYHLHPRAGRPRGSPRWPENLPGARGFIFRKARAGVLEKTHGLFPAPLRILDVVSAGLDLPLAEALELEARAFGELAVSPESKSLTHLFFASTAAKNDPMLPSDVEAAEIDRVGIVGSGFMGAGIATVTAENGIRVRLKDITPEAVARGVATTRESLRKRAERRRRKDFEIVQLLDRIEGTAEYSGFRATDLVVEAVFEDLELKHRVIREMEESASPETVLATNTSTIPIARIAEAASHPERVIGIHFFSPVEQMPLVEIIVTGQTEPSVAATSHSFAKRIGKTPIIVNDAPGFYVNRILGPYMNEAALLLEQGVPMEEIDSAMVAWGFPVGPITLYDEVGLDVAAKSGQVLAAAFAERLQPGSVLTRLLEDDRKGRKNGRGFYKYDDGKKAGPDESVYALIGSPPARSVPPEEIQERLALGMINEAVRTLEDGVLRSARDGDVGAVFGIGFPPVRGGPFWYLDETGAARVVDRLRALEAVHGARFEPAPLLIEKAEKGERFHPD
ncbi:MAG: fatty acid oxidation complex subunit alpha FadJ [Gemmatimonas sp.]|nr:fatty acid oxidation complex subunit alpha FadJ [Gemmatimonas sp.]